MESPDNQFLIEVGHRLRQARLARGLNLHELARLTGISAPALSLIETGKRDLRLTTLSRIAAALRLPLPALLESEPAPGPAKTAPSHDDKGYDLGDYR
ncbi:helix-turn-helix domain-containing protein [Paenirhodobacter populi]|uniref:XRE family transcriptional regulator n=1 Tax=Paenirhodobacter populi TaxID=2306993 RepID=A0A443IRJ6_9RHOB|nr:XRE family transcriptional regulator [Sinirhodobacter populi]